MYCEGVTYNMLVAINEKNEKIWIENFLPNPKEKILAGSIRCPFCKRELLIKTGNVRVPHFAHKATDPDPNALCYQLRGESPEHLYFKNLLAKELSKEFNELINAEVFVEYGFQEINRIADVAFKLPSGWIVVHEVQLSSIDIETLESRTNDYEKIGVEVTWWFGRNANNDTTREWALRRFGAHYAIAYDKIEQPART